MVTAPRSSSSQAAAAAHHVRKGESSVVVLEVDVGCDNWPAVAHGAVAPVVAAADVVMHGKQLW